MSEGQHLPSSLQVTESGGVNVYLKEEQPGGYTLFCIDNHTSEALAKVYVGCEYASSSFLCEVKGISQNKRYN